MSEIVPYTKVLLTGARGQLARALHRAAPSTCQILALDRQQLDICDAAAIEKVLWEHAPDCVINGAAYNLVDQAETDQENAFRINHHGPAILANHCQEREIPLVHFSTDFVFDGKKKSPYTEQDTPHPLSVYAASKLAGEQAVLQASPRHLAIRVSRLFGPAAISSHSIGKKPAGNFPLAMLRLAQQQRTLRVVNDQIGSPSYTPDLAISIWQLLAKGQSGLFHLSNSGEVAFDEYARAVFEIAEIPCKVEGISSAEYNAPARRPRYSPLDNTKIHRTGIAPLRPWKDALRDYLQTPDLQNLIHQSRQ